MQALAASVGVACLLAWSVDPVPGDLIAYGRRMAINAGQSKILYAAEGSNSSVAISRWTNDTIYVNVNGHVEATTELLRHEAAADGGHLPALLHPNPKSVLGIGFGAGVSAGTFTRYPGIQKITVCEIEPVIPPASTRYFGDAGLRRLAQSAHAYRLRRRAPLPAHHHREVRHHRLRSAGCFRQRHRRALFEGIFRVGEKPSESRRHVLALRAAL